MSTFSRASARLNAACLRAAGFPVVYQQAGVDPITITAAYGMRDRSERGNSAAYESIWTTRAQLAASPAASPAGDTVIVDPQSGDLVTLGDLAYIVHDVKSGTDPEDDSISLYLKRSTAPRP
jgi:hypothetical protein